MVRWYNVMVVDGITKHAPALKRITTTKGCQMVGFRVDNFMEPKKTVIVYSGHDILPLSTDYLAIGYENHMEKKEILPRLEKMEEEESDKLRLLDPPLHDISLRGADNEVTIVYDPKDIARGIIEEVTG